MLAGRAAAQTFTVLHTFTPISYATNRDGANPSGDLVLSGNTLYGTAENGGSAAPRLGSNGTVFRINTDGSGFTILHSFSNSDGANPYYGLALGGGTLYGTTLNGGSSSNGTVFRVNTDGSGFTNLHSFTALLGHINSDGANPCGTLKLSSNTLYGTAKIGGSAGSGTVFRLNTDGSGFTVLHAFSATPPPFYTNTDGAFPDHVILSGDTLCGSTLGGGYTSLGSIFKLKLDGSGFTNLAASIVGNPGSVDILFENTLYGTRVVSPSGSIFKINADGTGHRDLYKFTSTSVDPQSFRQTNTDGQSPQKLILSGNTLYGTATHGGLGGHGTVFRVNTDGTGFTNLHVHSKIDEGCGPNGGLLLSSNTLYGTTGGCGEGSGTVFSLSLLSTIQPPCLTIIPFGESVILTWPTNALGFGLQSAPTLVSPVGWSAVSPEPVSVNGSNTVLNPNSGAQQFYRLKQED